MTALNPNASTNRIIFQNFDNSTLVEADTDDYYDYYYYSSDGSYECLYADKEYFWISGVLLVIFGVVGVLGNIFTLVVLCQPKMRKSTFYNLLLVLACFDTLFILTYGIAIAYRSLECRAYYQDKQISDNVISELFSWSDHFLVGSSYTTVAISLERYLGICHPSLQFSRRSLIFILPVLLLSITYRFLKYHVWQYLLPFNMWFDWYPIFLQSILPLIALLLLNGFIIAAIKRSRNLPRTHTRQEENTIKILFGIVLIFFILHLPRVFYTILMYNILFFWPYFSCPSCLHAVYTLTLVINSSVNFVIYSLVGKNFRAELVRVFKYKKAHILNTSSSGGTEVLSLRRLSEI